MVNIIDIIDECSDKIERALFGMRSGGGADFGLDRRAVGRIWTDYEVIVVDGRDDRTLQYYGGFEYVDPAYRHVIGQWVIYSNEDDRVQEAIEHFYTQQNAEESTEE